MRRTFLPGNWQAAGLSLLVLAVVAGCTRAGAGRQTITIKGSDTMVILGQRWAEEYMRRHPEVHIQVTGGGSGTGIAALINGTTRVAQASRKMTPAERGQAERRHGKPVREIVTAMDGVAVYVNEGNPVESLTLAQVRALYTGQITNWKDVGGPDLPVVLYGRENNSGTYVFVKEHVLEGADYSPSTRTLSGTAAVVSAVASDPGGVGYGGIAYGRGVRHLKIRLNPSSPAVGPSLETVRSGAYPLARPLHWYLVDDGDPAVQALVDWVLSPEGQRIVDEVGYFPIR
ncbi:phosphate ABC transporter substrate-binding protein [Caldinitratiruptor microaerophilus]|uniref:Phosphate-binding protein n=1 Tax=Caldinitratiruptor microaerophilus TaxID=671077 RepID=A0AA35G646_9FIRM|nr:phosphate ABC transporter substrate-binding protein [Caldinitratiruptor microaerophilus]BDG60706.1 phosphate-binding protein [Caldinitratiruptor microaerophilus]